MPKKTRKQKVISAYRKKLKLLEQLNQSQVKDVIPTPSPKNVSDELPPEKNQEKLPVDEKDLMLKIFLKKDLKKSLLLIALIIALEIIIYFGTINNYFKL